ncbi:NAPE-hydrolyzing phospholipase D [Gaeumannomyces tritici R3-111a-1]|uniref:NAPE-hydrolyzing phospholipase D n=1 Tax=Gaeumannomyces tritici (strain R3-111a-1) TaxID=644352 RepID=J3P604_GAET3|nr:NAPE-hydrolyzing phospholipase D [Gaeumannomyces tritici R3-111a-1]EJT75106.1 NAPE-hydrolyzing phospholipase D [Gaeumannomyces tritici R3-111a-1]
MASSLARSTALAPSVALRLPKRLVPTTTTPMAYAASVTPTTGPVPDSAAAKAHHVLGRHGERVGFVNPHPSAGVRLSITQQGSRALKAKWRGELAMPNGKDHKIKVVEPALLKTRAPPASLRATWLGHACYFIEFPSGLRLLFDPVFEKTCSPLPEWMPPNLARITPPPCLPKDLPFVDAVVISHSHYDHLSLNTVKGLVATHPGVHFFVGLGLASWFRSSGIDNVTEMDWWEDRELKLVDKDAQHEILATVSCLPCQHTSGRTLSDRDTTLWASWAVSSGGRSVWFGGDTGYRAVPQLPRGEDDYGPQHADLPRNPDFADIGRLRGPFDLGLIPIGAYDPRWLFSPVHSDPFDAVEIFKDTRCARAMGVHWGTWVLTTEAVEDPPRLLKEALRRSGLEEGVFDVCAVGETREF